MIRCRKGVSSLALASKSQHSMVRSALFSSSEKMYPGNKTLGMVREEYGMWERRAPLSPEHVKQLVSSGYKVLVQPCARYV
jgi:hypothetical protein